MVQALGGGLWASGCEKGGCGPCLCGADHVRGKLIIEQVNASVASERGQRLPGPGAGLRASWRSEPQPDPHSQEALPGKGDSLIES